MIHAFLSLLYSQDWGVEDHLLKALDKTTTQQNLGLDYVQISKKDKKEKPVKAR